MLRQQFLLLDLRDQAKGEEEERTATQRQQQHNMLMPITVLIFDRFVCWSHQSRHDIPDARHGTDQR